MNYGGRPLLVGKQPFQLDEDKSRTANDSDTSFRLMSIFETCSIIEIIAKFAPSLVFLFVPRSVVSNFI